MPPQGFLNPEQVLQNWDVRTGEKVADFGCGPGFYDVPLGQKVGPNGKIYAFDIRLEALETTRSKAKLFHVFNIEPTRADLEVARGSGLRDMAVDKVLVANILFQAPNQSAVLDEAVRVLRPGGSLLVIEWNDNDTSHPIPSSKVNKEEIKTVILSKGLILVKEFTAGSHHYGLVFTKKE
ncbi:MAG: methyltransferase domain-containing protein [bacterium]|nr:methyltransferase domain-containing protein [bacterium]